MLFQLWYLIYVDGTLGEKELSASFMLMLEQQSAHTASFPLLFYFFCEQLEYVKKLQIICFFVLMNALENTPKLKAHRARLKSLSDLLSGLFLLPSRSVFFN